MPVGRGARREVRVESFSGMVKSSCVGLGWSSEVGSDEGRKLTGTVRSSYAGVGSPEVIIPSPPVVSANDTLALHRLDCLSCFGVSSKLSAGPIAFTGGEGKGSFVVSIAGGGAKKKVSLGSVSESSGSELDVGSDGRSSLGTLEGVEWTLRECFARGVEWSPILP